MDKVLNISGGMPRRTVDLELIQNVTSAALKSIVKGLTGGPCIVLGLEISLVGSTLSITEGFYFDGTEIFYVPGASFTYHTGYQPYLEQNFSTTQQRTFHDLTVHNCWELRRYQAQYASSVPQTCVQLLNLKNLSTIVAENSLTTVYLAKTLSPQASLIYYPSYSPATAYGSPVLNANSLGEVQILAAFNTSINNGKLTVIPADYRPPADIVRFFMAGSGIGQIRIKKNGDVYALNASVTSVNYVEIIYTTLFTDPINYNHPDGGGTFTPD